MLTYKKVGIEAEGNYFIGVKYICVESGKKELYKVGVTYTSRCGEYLLCPDGYSRTGRSGAFIIDSTVLRAIYGEDE